MKVICPKCQFENLADSSRVVCARCATIIEVRVDQGAGYDSNGKRQTARLPFANSSSSNNNQPLSNQPYSQNQDVYATRIGDDFDDVLDVPLQSQSNYQAVEDAVPVFEDVFTAPSQDQNSVYDFASYGKTSDTYRQDATRQRETLDYSEPAEQEFMGWPVLPEGSGDEEEVVRGSRFGFFVRVGVTVGVFGVLCFLAYYFLGDIIFNKITNKPGEAASTKAQNANQQANTNPPAQTAPQVVTPKPADTTPAQEAKTKPGEVVAIPPLPGGGRQGHTDTPKPAVSSGDAPLTAPNKGNLTIQVGSFKDQGEADSRATRLKSSVGNEVRVVKAVIPGLGTYNRLQVGGFISREAAQSYGNLLRSKNVISEFIVTSK